MSISIMKKQLHYASTRPWFSEFIYALLTYTNFAITNTSIINSFSWEASIQGYDYWDDIYREVRQNSQGDLGVVESIEIKNALKILFPLDQYPEYYV